MNFRSARFKRLAAVSQFPGPTVCVIGCSSCSTPAPCSPGDNSCLRVSRVRVSTRSPPRSSGFRREATPLPGISTYMSGNF